MSEKIYIIRKTQRWLVLFIFLTLFSINLFSKNLTKPILIGVSSNNPPFEFLDVNGVSKGFEIDLIKAIMKELDLEYKFVIVKNGVNSLNLGKVDIILDYNNDKDKSFCYSYCYNKINFQLYVDKNSPYHSLKDLENKKILSSNLTSIKSILQKASINAEVIKSTDVLSTIANFDKDKYDAFFIASDSYFFYSNMLGNFNVRKLEKSSFDTEMYFTAKKENEYLMTQINDALFTLKFSGVYNKIKSAWLTKKKESFVLYRNILIAFICVLIIVILILINILRAEEKLKKRQLKIYNETFKSLPFLMGLFEINKNGINLETKLKLLNWYSSIGFKFENFTIINKNGSKLIDNTLIDGLNKILKENKDGYSYYHITFEDESSFDCVATYKFVNNKKKKILVLTVNNIGDLFYMKNKAIESEKETSAFLASLSHEIRTPLNAILGFSDMLDQSDDLETRKIYTDIILKNNELLETLINKVLLLSRVEVNKVSILRTKIDLVEFYEQNLLKYKNLNKDILFNYVTNIKKYDTSLDKNIIKIICENIIENAIKFTEKGLIEVGLFIYRGEVVWYCKDTGNGIPKMELKLICNKFEKSSSFKEGFGLGLSISLAYCNLIGSKMGVFSREKSGSLFWVKSKVNGNYEFNDFNDEDKLEEIIRNIENSYLFNERKSSISDFYINEILKQNHEKN